MGERYLTPAASKPLDFPQARPVVTGGGFRGSVVPATLQWQTADVVGHADYGSGSNAGTTFCRALLGQKRPWKDHNYEKMNYGKHWEETVLFDTKHTTQVQISSWGNPPWAMEKGYAT